MATNWHMKSVVNVQKTTREDFARKKSKRYSLLKLIILSLLSNCLCACLSVCLSIRLFVRLPVCIFVCISVCFVFASYTKDKHYKNVMFDKFETRMLTQNIIINILCSPLYFQVTRICDRIIPTSTSQNLNSCTLTKKDCVTYSRNKLYMYKCYETSTFKDKQG